MHKREKSAIQTHRNEIAEDLFLEEDLLVKMTREKLFTSGMIEEIKSQKTMKDKSHRLLELLQKRGPEAFSKFIAILKEDYKWLATKLEETYKEKLEMEEMINSARTPRQLQLSFPPTPRETIPPTPRGTIPPTPRETKPKRLQLTRQTSRGVQESSSRRVLDSHGRAQSAFFPDNFEVDDDDTDGQAGQLTRSTTEANAHYRHKADACLSPIQALTPSRRYKHTASSPYPLDRQLHSLDIDPSGSEDDNSASDDEVLYQDSTLLENPNALEGQDETDAPIIGVDEPGFEDEITDNNVDANETDEDKILVELFLKLHKINTENDCDSESPVPEDFGQITLAMVHEEIDKLVRRVDNAETTLDQVYKILGSQDPKVPVELQIKKLIESKAELVQSLEKEKRENESMVNDMYNISQELKKLNNLKHRNAKYETEIRDLKTELEKTRQESETKIDELEKKVLEAERERKQSELLQHPQHSPQAARRRPSRTYVGASRRTGSMNLHQTSSFDLFSSKSKFSYRRK